MGRLWHKGVFQASATSALTQAHWGAFRQPGGNATASQSLGGPPQAHLPAVPNRDEGAGGMEGPSATCQQVGSVVGLQHPHEVGTLHLVGTRAGDEGLFTISSGPKAQPCLADQLWGSRVTFFMDLQEPSVSLSAQAAGGVATGYPGVLVRAGGSHSRKHSPKDLVPFEYTPPSALAVAATGPETQPG